MCYEVVGTNVTSIPLTERKKKTFFLAFEFNYNVKNWEMNILH